MRFIKIEFPEQAKKNIESMGGKCVSAFTCEDGMHFIAALVTDDPRGQNGEMERHLSVSASTCGLRRKPRSIEIREAMKAAGVSGRVSFGVNVAHVYESLPKGCKDA